MALASLEFTSVPLTNMLLNPEGVVPTFSANSEREIPNDSMISNSLLVESGKFSAGFGFLPLMFLNLILQMNLNNWFGFRFSNFHQLCKPELSRIHRIGRLFAR